MLASFAAYLASSVRPGTVSGYLAAVRNLHLESGLPDPTLEAILLPRVLKGIKREHGVAPRMTRLPLTGDLVRQAIQELLRDQSVCDLDRLMFQSAILLGFYGFLRCGEFTVSDKEFDPAKDMTLDCVSVVYSEGKPILELHVKRSKTDPFGRGMTLYIGTAVPPYCPVVAMIQYRSKRQLPPRGPLYTLSNGTPLTRGVLTEKLRSLLLAAGVTNADQYSGHSFRIGAATTAAAAGVPEWKIRAMGRWQSDCVLRYIRSQPSDLAGVASQLYSAPI